MAGERIAIRIVAASATAFAIPSLVILLLFGCSKGFAANSPPSSNSPALTLDLAMPGVEVPPFVVPPEGGKISLNLIHTHRTSCKVDLSLSSFIDEHGDSAEVKLFLPPETEEQAQPQRLGFKLVPGSPLQVVLSVPKLPNTDKFTGRLIVSKKGGPPQVWKLVLTRSRQGTLILSRQAVTLDVTLPCCWPWVDRQLERLCLVKADQPFSVDLREKGGQTILNGISARLEQVSKAPGRGFDLRNNVDFTLNGVPVPDFETWPAKDPNDKADRTIAAGGQETVGMTLHDLAPGEYNAVIRFSAVDSADDDGQKLALTVRVRSSAVASILCLIAALVLSLLSTKAVGAAKQRSDLLKRIGQLKTPWLAEQEPVVPVVWASAAIHQSEKLSRRLLLASPDEISARVEQAEHLLPVLDKIRQLEEKLEGARMPWLVRKRAQDALNRIVREVGMSLSDPHALKGFEDQLVALGWLDPEKMDGLYWSAVKNSMIALHAEIVAESIAGVSDATDEQKKRADTLRNLSQALGRGLEAAGSKVLALEKALDYDRKYSVLKLLWARRKRSEDFDKLLKELVGPINPKTPLVVDIESFFHTADGQDWERIKARGTLKAARADDKQKDAPTNDKQVEKKLSIRPPPPPTGLSRLKRTRCSGSPSKPAIRSWTRPTFSDTAFDANGSSRLIATGFLDGLPDGFGEKKHRPPRHQIGGDGCGGNPWSGSRGLSNPASSSMRTGQDSLEAEVELSRAAAPSVLTAPSVLSATMQLPNNEKGLKIKGSSKFRGWKALRAAEWGSWALAGVAAIVTGLTTFYVKNPTFGSFQDYLTLIAWGAGFDQGKNAVQSLRGASTTTPAKPS